MKTTLVTAFYPVKSKFSVEKYMEWIKNYMLLQSPIVLFTDVSMESIFRELRNGLPIHIIVKPFTESYMWKKYEENWKYDHDHDHEKERHSPELYAVWANKSVWVKEAITINPFQTEHFFWCDIGAFRDATQMHYFIEKFPDPSYFPEKRVLFCSVERCTLDDYKQSNGIIGNFFLKNRIVGGLWGGVSNACLRFAEAYERKLQQYFSVKRFAGKDQSVMLSALLEDPSLGLIVKPTIESGDWWFFLEYLLSGIGSYEIDVSYFDSKGLDKEMKSQLSTLEHSFLKLNVYVRNLSSLKKKHFFSNPFSPI